MKRLALSTTLLAVVVLIAACEVSRAQETFDIALLLDGADLGFSAAIGEGALRAASSNSRAARIDCFIDFDFFGQLGRISEAVARGYDAIVLQPITPIGLGPAVADAMRAGVPVVMVGGFIFEDSPLTTIASDYCALGADTAWEAIRQLQSPQMRGNLPLDTELLQNPWQIALLSSPIATAWTEGVLDVLDPIIKAGHAAVHQVHPDPYELEALLGDSMIDAIIADGDDLAWMAMEAVDRLGFDGIVTVATGRQGSIDLVGNVHLTAAVVPLPFTMGYWGVIAAVKFLEGGWEAPEFLPVPGMVITKENAKQAIEILGRPRLFPTEPVVMDNYVALLLGIDYGPNEMWSKDATFLADAMVGWGTAAVAGWNNWKAVEVPDSPSGSSVARVEMATGPITGDSFKEAMEDYIDEFPRYVFKKDGDTLFFFFASAHGSNPLDTNNPEYERPDGDALNACDETIATWGTSISDDDLTSYEARLPDSEKILKLNLIDTCYSGGFWGGGDDAGDSDYVTRWPGDLETLKRTVLISSAPEDLTAGGNAPFVKSLGIGITRGYSAGSGLEGDTGEIAPADSSRPVFVKENWVHRDGRWCRGNGNEDGMITIDEWFYWGYNAVDILRGRSGVCSGYTGYDETFADDFRKIRIQSMDTSEALQLATAATEPCIYWSGGSATDFQDPFGLNPFGNVVLFTDEPAATD